MRKRKKEITLMFLSALCCLTLSAGCGSKEKNPAEGEKNEEVQSAGTDSLQEISGSGEQKGTENIGEFSTEDVQGNSYTQEMFGDYDLTMVNVFATWCGPCISEIPDLEKLYGEMKEQGVNVAGIVLDAADGSGNPDAEAVEKAKLLAEKTGASYPFLVPDAGYFGGRLAGINAVPETFFVDKEGNIIGETYSGSRSFEEWKEIVAKELENISQ